MKNKIIYSAKKYLNYINKNNILLNLKTKIIYIIFTLFILRIGNFIPIYGIKFSNILSEIKSINKEKITFNIINLLFNTYINKISIFSLGIMPYISASMIVQLLMLTIPFFKKLKNNEFENNQNIINKYIYIFTFILSIFYSMLIVLNINNFLYYKSINNFNIIIFSIISMVYGTIFLVWLSDQITNIGFGNGVSIIIFINIVSNIFKYLKSINLEIINRNFNILSLMIIIFITYLLMNISVFIECSQRKILINYPKQYFFGKNFIKSSSSYLPIKINISGVMPVIFSYSFLTFQNFLLSFIKKYLKSNFILKFLLLFEPGNILFIIINTLLIFLFSFLYSSISFNIKETSDNLKKSGAFILNIRPGNNTYIYIKKIVNKLIFIGSIYTNILCLIPELIKYLLNLEFYLNGISLLIVVIVSIEIITQIQTIIISTQYESILKKINLY